jgi:fibronectin-binding autotransporter adhesin
MSASYSGWSAQAFGELGYRSTDAPTNGSSSTEASSKRLHTNGFQESGGASSLTGFAQEQDLGTTTLGLRAEACLSNRVPLIARGLLGWRHVYGDVNPTALMAFAGGVTTFVVAGTPIDRDALAAEAGLEWQDSDAISLGIAYSGQVGERAQEHALKGSFAWRFGTY